MGAMHILEGLKDLKQLRVREEELQAWRYLGYNLLTRRK